MRLDGWKAIGAHFGRERSTVIRWATERGLPVHRIPGPGRGSVYALTEELDAWLEAHRQAGGDSSDGEAPLVEAVAPPTPAAVATPSQPAHSRSFLAQLRRLPLRYALLPVGLGVASLSAWAISRNGEVEEAVLLPDDAALADLYLQARSEWAERNPQSIAGAITKLQQVTSGDPGFAPAYAALADSYILAREFGSLEDEFAFGRAQRAVDSALRIDPDNADALRADGFIHYWWHNDGQAAGRSFRQSLAANDNSAQTHFWYGNVLIDNGDFAEGMAQLERARLLEPALVPMQVDIAWARWAAGDTMRGRREMEALLARNPDMATIHDYLTAIYLEDGDLPEFVAANRAYGELRGLPEEVAFARQLETALASDPAMVLPIVQARLDADIASGARWSLPWPVFVATAARDRPAVVRLLDLGLSRGEKWNRAGLLRYVRQQWRDDAEITTKLDELASPSIAGS